MTKFNLLHHIKCGNRKKSSDCCFHAFTQNKNDQIYSELWKYWSLSGDTQIPTLWVKDAVPHTAEHSVDLHLIYILQ